MHRFMLGIGLYVCAFALVAETRLQQRDEPAEAAAVQRELRTHSNGVAELLSSRHGARDLLAATWLLDFRELPGLRHEDSDSSESTPRIDIRALRERALATALEEGDVAALNLWLPHLAKQNDHDGSARVRAALREADASNLNVWLAELAVLDRRNEQSQAALEAVMQAAAQTTHLNTHYDDGVRILTASLMSAPLPPNLLRPVKDEYGIEDAEFAAAVPAMDIMATLAFPPTTALFETCLPDDTHGVVSERLRADCMAVARIASLDSDIALSEMIATSLWRRLAAGTASDAEALRHYRDVRWRYEAWTQIVLDGGSDPSAELVMMKARLRGADEIEAFKAKLVNADIPLEAPEGWQPSSPLP